MSTQQTRNSHNTPCLRDALSSRHTADDCTVLCDSRQVPPWGIAPGGRRTQFNRPTATAYTRLRDFRPAEPSGSRDPLRPASTSDAEGQRTSRSQCSRRPELTVDHMRQLALLKVKLEVVEDSRLVAYQSLDQLRPSLSQQHARYYQRVNQEHGRSMPSGTPRACTISSSMKTPTRWISTPTHLTERPTRLRSRRQRP
jgi:hypothetical protein